MYRPGRGIDLATPLVQMWAWVVYLWRPPEKPLSPRSRVFLSVAGAAIGLLASAAGVGFAIVTFREADPWARFMVALFTFGLFGLPTSVVAIVIGAILVHARASTDTANSAAAILLAIAYFAQWLGLAGTLWRRSRISSSSNQR